MPIDEYIFGKVSGFVSKTFELVPKSYKIFPNDGEMYEFDPEKDQEKHIIIDTHDEELEAIRREKKFQLKKWVYFVICVLSAMVGVTLCLLGLSLTAFFEKFGKNDMLFYCSFAGYVPFLCYFKYLFIPGRRERRNREYLKRHRLWRKAVNKQRRKRYIGIVDSDEESEADEQKSPRNKQASGSLRTSMRNNSLGVGVHSNSSATKFHDMYIHKLKQAGHTANLPTPNAKGSRGVSAVTSNSKGAGGGGRTKSETEYFKTKDLELPPMPANVIPPPNLVQMTPQMRADVAGVLSNRKYQVDLPIANEMLKAGFIVKKTMDNYEL
jgi:hypothetical protein